LFGVCTFEEAEELMVKINLEVLQFDELKSNIIRNVAGGPDGKAAGKFLIQYRPTCGRECN